MTAIDLESANVSEAWLGAVSALQGTEGQKAFHTVVRIAHPTEEEPRVRSAVDRLLAELDLYSVETVANTIFPAQLAATSRDHEHLVERYRGMYPTLKARLADNRHGTYFGRLVAYPAGGASLDQIGMMVGRLVRERAGGQPKSARYEIAVAHPTDLVPPPVESGETGAHGDGHEPHSDPKAAPIPTHATPIYIPGTDNSPMGFPCLSHCSFQLGRDDRLHALAHYRSQYLVQRGYGNYLGLGRLLTHVARQAGVEPGRLTVVAGYAQIETAKLRIRRLLENAPAQS